jgi:hypothetical protein
LGWELLHSKGDAESEADIRADRDEIDASVRTAITGLTAAFSSLSTVVGGYLGILDDDLKPVFTPLIGRPGIPSDLQLRVEARHKIIIGFNSASKNLEATLDPDRMMTVTQAAQTRIRNRVSRKTSRREGSELSLHVALCLWESVQWLSFSMQ